MMCWHLQMNLVNKIVVSFWLLMMYGLKVAIGSISQAIYIDVLYPKVFLWKPNEICLDFIAHSKCITFHMTTIVLDLHQLYSIGNHENQNLHDFCSFHREKKSVQNSLIRWYERRKFNRPKTETIWNSVFNHSLVGVIDVSSLKSFDYNGSWLLRWPIQNRLEPLFVQSASRKKNNRHDNLYLK